MTNNINRKLNILMLVAHPDDDALFGFSDLLQNNCTVICFSNNANTVRKNEFFECMKLSNLIGYILNYPDGKYAPIINDENCWIKFDDEHFLKSILGVITINSNFDAIVSHDKNGDYGHPHHKRIHNVATYISNKFKIKFYDFKSRFDKKYFSEKENMEKYENLLNCYKSEKHVLKVRRWI
jgi:LmbE family N-acetylglucosaminyl deacetylase